MKLEDILCMGIVPTWMRSGEDIDTKLGAL